MAEIHLSQIVSTLVYSLIGIFVFIFFYVLLEKLTPFSMRKEIEEDQNVALGIIIGCALIGISIIISAAIH